MQTEIIKIKPIWSISISSYIFFNVISFLLYIFIKIEPKNYWGKTYLILKEGAEKGSIDVDWKNNITITFIDQNEITQIFKMTKKGFWKQQFEFSNLKGEIVIVLIPLSTWKKWTNDLAIASPSQCADQKYFDELVIYCGFVVRLIEQYAGAGVV